MNYKHILSIALELTTFAAEYEPPKEPEYPPADEPPMEPEYPPADEYSTGT